MAEEEKIKKEVKIINKYHHGGAGGAVYGLGFVGALIYFIQHSATFMDGVIGLLKALVWPAFLVYKALELLKF
jgi:hypothetical protein